VHRISKTASVLRDEKACLVHQFTAQMMKAASVLVKTHVVRQYCFSFVHTVFRVPRTALRRSIQKEIGQEIFGRGLQEMCVRVNRE
jgi:hypothetical protein